MIPRRVIMKNRKRQRYTVITPNVSVTTVVFSIVSPNWQCTIISTNIPIVREREFGDPCMQ